MRGDDISTVRCRFMERPEFIQKGKTIIFRESEIKGYGRITKIFHDIKIPILKGKQKKDPYAH